MFELTCTAKQTVQGHSNFNDYDDEEKKRMDDEAGVALSNQLFGRILNGSYAVSFQNTHIIHFPTNQMYLIFAKYSQQDCSNNAGYGKSRIVKTLSIESLKGLPIPQIRLISIKDSLCVSQCDKTSEKVEISRIEANIVYYGCQTVESASINETTSSTSIGKRNNNNNNNNNTNNTNNNNTSASSEVSVTTNRNTITTLNSRICKINNWKCY